MENSLAQHHQYGLDEPQPQLQPAYDRIETAQRPLRPSPSIKRKPVANDAAPATTETPTPPLTAVPPIPPRAAGRATPTPQPPVRNHAHTIRDPEKQAHDPEKSTLSKSYTGFSSVSSSTTSIPSNEKELSAYVSTHKSSQSYSYTPKANPQSRVDAALPPLPASDPKSNTNAVTNTQNQIHAKRTTTPLGAFHTLKSKFLSLRKRTRYLILSTLLVLLLLIIILPTALTLSKSNKFKNLPLPTSHGGPYTGDLTYYEPGLGACGVTSTSADFIVAVSHYVFDAVQKGSDPNTNPLCGKKIRAERDGKSVELTVVDRCVGCQPDDIDTTTTVFSGLAQIAQGRVKVTWAWLEDVPTGATV